MTPLDAMKLSLFDAEALHESLEPEDWCGDEPMLNFTERIITNLRTAIAEMESAEPVAWLHSHRSESDVITNKVKRVWGGVAVGKEAQYTIPLFTHPAQSRNDNEPTYGQLKIRLENANKTIEMQRCELFDLRDANHISRDSIIEECAVVCEAQKETGAHIRCATAIRALKGEK